MESNNSSLRAAPSRPPKKPEISQSSSTASTKIPAPKSLTHLESVSKRLSKGVHKSSSKPTTPKDNLKRGSFFKSYRGRSAWDADEDEFDSGRKYSTATLSKVETPSTPALLTSTKHPSLSPPSPPRTSPDPPKKHQTRSSSMPSSLNGLFEPDDDESDSQEVTWIWVGPIENVKSIPSGTASEELETNSPVLDAVTGVSKLSFTPASDTSSTSVIAQPYELNDYTTIRNGKAKDMGSSMTVETGASSSTSSSCDPEDELLDVDKVVATFKASYKRPMPHAATTTSALSYSDTSSQNTARSVMLSPAKRAEQQRLREEERIQDELEELRNTYYYNPDGDLNDEVMEQVQNRHNVFFPAEVSNSWRSMHVIDLAAYFMSNHRLLQQARPRLCDAVATVLCHTNKECLKAFLNPSIKEFAYRRELDNSKAGLILIIRRKGNEVICGAYHNLGFRMLWKLYVKSLISVTGQWYEVYATMKTSEMLINKGVPDWDMIETGCENADPAPTKGSLHKLALRQPSSQPKEPAMSNDIDETNPNFMLYQNRILAKYLLWDMWFCFDNLYECRATWEADSQVSNVRLKRALVGSHFGGD